ncbi:ionotropic receptor 93a-like isoform X2 [Daphnia carinata]|nr:ionotropic receptor 93a-like isoform X2 [Daphnia carinata]XP_057374700.1 ionotropic receptor 93a-like isoform X2 [Daphnia carinata]XP_059352072.1 ionotropic receptor 93a-like isoform X2 [Daphnia carinata]
MKFVAIHNPPFDIYIRGPNGTFTLSGVATNIVGWMSKYYNFKVTLVAVNESLVEKFGTNEAAYHQLTDDEAVDGIICGFGLTLDRMKRMGYTSSFVWVDGFSLVVPKPGEESRLFAFTGPFQPTVWLFILISLLFMVGVMAVFTWFYKNPSFSNYKDISITNRKEDSAMMKPDRNKISNYVSSNLIYVVNILTNQGCREAFDRHSFRVLAGFWLLGAMVLVNSYSGIVISSLTVPKMKPPIESLEDLASNKETGIVLRHDMTMGIQILNAVSGVYKVLGDKARQDRNQIVGDAFKLNKMLETGKYAYPFIQTFNTWFVALQYRKDGRCRFQVSKPLRVPYGYYFWLTKKGSSNTKLLNDGLVKLWESGISRFWANNQTGLAKAAECFDSRRQKTSAQQVPIRLYDLTSAFLILGIGLGLAILCFLIELIQSRFRRQTQQMQSKGRSCIDLK